VPALPAETLALHVHTLKRRYRIVPAAELLQAAARRRRGGRLPIAITFDDDLRSHIEVAAPILARYDVPATFFLTGIGLSGRSFWWQSLQAAIDRGTDVGPVTREFGLAAAPLEALTLAIEKLPPGERRSLADRLEALAGDDPERRALDEQEIGRLTGQGLTVGFHTRGHDRMTALDDADLHAAVRQGREELEAASGTPLTLIAYPHGDADERVAAAAAGAGFELGFVTAMEPVTPETPRLLLNRPEILAPTASRFALDLARIYVRALRARTASSSS
jgi:peptidoglycan/xylan/chitin deacetylase (PgdA/CDA1 family)